MKFGVVVFPGTNGDRDCGHVIETVLEQPVEYLWHKSNDLKNCDVVILPGGFAHGDYLRPGALAKHAPIMEAIVDFAKDGGLVLGIGNGFQILLEAGLLPGVMTINDHLQFRFQQISLQVENNQTPFTSLCSTGKVLNMPIAHRYGSYYCDEATLQQLKENKQIVFRYRNGNPNGSLDSIAGICNKEGNVLGIMARPERCAEAILGNEDGAVIFKSMLATGQRRSK